MRIIKNCYDCHILKENHIYLFTVCIVELHQDKAMSHTLTLLYFVSNPSINMMFHSYY